MVQRHDFGVDVAKSWKIVSKKGGSCDARHTKLSLIISLRDSGVLFEGSDVVDIQLHSVLVRFLQCLASLLRMCLGQLEFLLINRESQLFRHETGKIYWEAVGVVQAPHVLARKTGLSPLLGLRNILVEKLLATIEGT